MDHEEMKDKILERFNNLQPEIQAAIMNSNYEKILYDIAQNHKLNIKEMGELEFNTTLVLLGQIHPDEYAMNLEEDLKLPKETIDAIVGEVNEQIMKNIREIIKKNFEKDAEDDKDQEEVPVPPYLYTPKVEEVKQPIAEITQIKTTPEIIVMPPALTTTPIVAQTPKIELDIYQNAGIEMISDKKEPVEDLNRSIIASKLSSITSSRPTTSDHSIPKVTPPTSAPSVKPHDPYHEAI